MVLQRVHNAYKCSSPAASLNAKQLKAPYIIYADFEALNVPVTYMHIADNTESKAKKSRK